MAGVCAGMSGVDRPDDVDAVREYLQSWLPPGVRAPSLPAPSVHRNASTTVLPGSLELVAGCCKSNAVSLSHEL